MTTGAVTVRPQDGTTAFADCTGPPGYTCGSNRQLNGTPMTAVITRSETDALGNPLPLPAVTVSLTVNSPNKGSVTASVTFAAGATRSETLTVNGGTGHGANGNVVVTATPESGWSPSVLNVKV